MLLSIRSASYCSSFAQKDEPARRTAANVARLSFWDGAPIPAALRSVVRTISQQLKHMLGAFKWGLIKRISEAVRKPAFGRTAIRALSAGAVLRKRSGVKSSSSITLSTAKVVV
jgi:hypothetical protein